MGKKVVVNLTGTITENGMAEEEGIILQVKYIYRYVQNSNGGEHNALQFQSNATEKREERLIVGRVGGRQKKARQGISRQDWASLPL